LTQKAWILIGITATVVVGISAYALSPFLAFNNLKDAAKTGDRDRLEEFVDFPAVRENLKSQIAASLMKSISADPKMRDNPFAAMGALLVPTITDRMVDSIVTPDGIAVMLSQGKVSEPGGEPSTESVRTKGASNLETALSYKTLDRFHADIQRRDKPDITLALTLERRGWFRWKLIRIDIPQSLFNPTPPKEAVSATSTRSIEVDLQFLDLREKLRTKMGLGLVGADNAARYYLHKPTSQCGLLVKSTLEGDIASKAKLMEFPDYCKWRD